VKVQCGNTSRSVKKRAEFRVLVRDSAEAHGDVPQSLRLIRRRDFRSYPLDIGAKPSEHTAEIRARIDAEPSVLDGREHPIDFRGKGTALCTANPELWAVRTLPNSDVMGAVSNLRASCLAGGGVGRPNRCFILRPQACAACV